MDSFSLPDICTSIGADSPVVFWLCFIQAAEDPEGFLVVQHKLQPDPVKYWQLVKHQNTQNDEEIFALRDQTLKKARLNKY